MERFIIGVGLCVAMSIGVPAGAQTESTADRQAAPSESAAAEPAPPVDATKLGVSFDRVRMQLSQAPAKSGGGLKLEETIEVVGAAPKPLLWNQETAKLTSSAVPFGAPTHKDMMKVIVPKEFQTYPLDLNALMQWLMEHLNEKNP